MRARMPAAHLVIGDMAAVRKGLEAMLARRLLECSSSIRSMSSTRRLRVSPPASSRQRTSRRSQARADQPAWRRLHHVCRCLRDTRIGADSFPGRATR